MKNKQSLIRRSMFLFCAMMLLGALSGCGSAGSSQKSSEKIQVVAAEDFYGEVAKAVGGNHVVVTSIINKPSVDPHDFEPTIDTAKAVNKARLVVYNGIGYDGWMDKLVSSSGSSQTPVIRVAEDIMNKKDGDNEHLWYNPDTMPKLAAAIANKLAKIDPKNGKEYRQNAKKYQASIKPIKDLVAKLNQKSDNKKVDVSEPVFDYMLQALKYKEGNVKFSKAVEDGNDPAPTDIANMQKDIKNHKIAFFVDNIQASDPTVKKMVRLAVQSHTPVVKVTETMPSGKDYKTWMLGELKQVEKIQNNQ